MMRVDPFFVQNTLASLNQVELTQQQLTQQLSSGVSVTSLSSNPGAAAQDSTIANEMSADATFTQSSATTTGQMQVVDSTLGSLVTQMTQAISVATEGNNGTLDAANESAIAQQLAGIRNQVLSLANTTYQGVAIFAGSKTNVAPFSLDTTTSPATVTYSGDNVAPTTQTPSGSVISTSIPGDAVFGGGSGTSANVLGILNNLIDDFSSGTSAIADTEALSTSLSQVSTIRAQFDGSLNQMQSAVTYTQTQQVQLQSSEDALVQDNPAQTATDLSNAEVQRNALLNVMASISQEPNLFSYLK
jgi:flagellar hook-associated protein 3 FlgL